MQIYLRNDFLRYDILQNEMPFDVKYPELKPEVTGAMEEAMHFTVWRIYPKFESHSGLC